MPRVTGHEQYRRHLFLQMLWREPGMDIFFTLLPVYGQWQLHDYYAPSLDLTEQELDQRRKDLDATRPSLRHLAGKSFTKIEQVFIAMSRRFGADRKQINAAVLAAMANSNRPISNGRDTGSARSSQFTLSFVAKPLDAREVARAFLRAAEARSRESDKHSRAS